MVRGVNVICAQTRVQPLGDRVFNASIRPLNIYLGDQLQRFVRKRQAKR
jgi:hypothetical protein